MTIPQFLAALPAALATVEAEPLQHTQGVYPRGELLRVKVKPPAGRHALPPILDPVGVVGYARSGAFRGVLAGLQTAVALGLEVDEALVLLTASDRVARPGEDWRVADTRAKLIEVLEEWTRRVPDPLRSP